MGDTLDSFIKPSSCTGTYTCTSIEKDLYIKRLIYLIYLSYIFMPVPHNGLMKRRKHVARFEKKMILPENTRVAENDGPPLCLNIGITHNLKDYICKLCVFQCWEEICRLCVLPEQWMTRDM
jgi:hypothetical protein